MTIKPQSLRILKWLLALAASSILIGCAYGGKDGEQLKQETEDREYLLKSFQPVQGTYEKADRSAAGLNLILGLFPMDSDNNNNSSGETRKLPKLKLKYRILEGPLTPDVILDARYYQNTGEIIATGNGSDGSPLQVRANFNGNALVGEVTRGHGLLGPFSLVRKSTEVRAQSADPQVEFFNLLKERYKRLAGNYKGTVKSNSAFTPDFAFELEITLPETSEGGKTKLEMRAHYRLLGKPDMDSNRFLIVTPTFDRLETKTKLSMISTGTAANEPPDSRFLVIIGYMNEQTGKFVGSTEKGSDEEGGIIDKRGTLGSVTLEKIQ